MKSTWYRVKFRRKLTLKGHSLDGFYDEGRQLILIAYGQGQFSRISTLIHELLHAVDTEHKVGLTHKQIYKLEKALFSLLVDNDLV